MFKHFKKAIAMLLALTLILSMAPTFVFAADSASFAAIDVSAKTDKIDGAMHKYDNDGQELFETVNVSGQFNYDNAYAVLDLVNEERAKENLPALSMDESLLATAMQRAAETSIHFSHTRPDGSNCFSANDKMMGENVAALQSTPEAVMNSWMNSAGHKANILNADYKSIGIGCFIINGNRFWVQCFGFTAADSFSRPANKDVTASVTIAAETFTDTNKKIEVTYIFTMKLGSSSVQAGSSTSAVCTVNNPGFTYVNTVVDNSSFDWSSSSDAASVSNGVVTGISAGTATITATTKNGCYSMSDEITVTADNHTITFNTNGGSDVASITAETGATITAPADPTKDGYTFAGWFADEALTVPYTFSTMPAENITLYAKWDEIEPPVDIIGDFNGDGEVTNVDIVMLARYLVKLYPADNVLLERIERLGDINGDGKISNTDLVFLARSLVNK